MTDFFTYIVQNREQILSLLLDHIQLTCLAVGLAIVIGVPLGLLISYTKGLNKLVLGIASVIQAVPSMALLGFAIPFLGIGVSAVRHCGGAIFPAADREEYIHRHSGDFPRIDGVGEGNRADKAGNPL